jgi:hypothetical protein
VKHRSTIRQSCRLSNNQHVRPWEGPRQARDCNASSDIVAAFAPLRRNGNFPLSERRVSHAAMVGSAFGAPQMSEGLPTLLNYDAACRLLAEAVRVDEVRNIRDIAIAMRVYAKQAKNREAEADAVALRMRAVRRLAQLMQAQKETVGLSKGGRPAKTGSFERPGFATLAMQGIDKHLAHQARTLGALSDSDFETVVTDARDKVARAVRNAAPSGFHWLRTARSRVTAVLASWRAGPRGGFASSALAISVL